MSSESDSSAPTGAFRFAARTRHLQPSAIREILKVAEAPDVISFAGGLPAPDLFPSPPLPPPPPPSWRSRDRRPCSME
ncbi:MAG: hypothetical protein U1F61_08500 [Opitutaceae bacterium]